MKGISSHNIADFRNEILGDNAENTSQIVTKNGLARYEKEQRGRPRRYQTDAERQLAYRQRKKTQTLFLPLPTGPYRVIYADPPWQYKNDSYAYYGHAACKYQTLSIAQLCELQIKRLTEKNSVLFLWVTMPILPEVFPVVKDWGFEYKTGLVWDKERRNYGYYVGVQHELLLICTRGICRPEIQTLEASVQRIPPTGHSRKPTEFRILIDHLYPTGRRLELFAREHVDGWDAWGNEVMDKGVSSNGNGRKDST